MTLFCDCDKAKSQTAYKVTLLMGVTALYEISSPVISRVMFLSLQVWKSGRGPGIFSHVSGVRIGGIVERV